MRETPFINNAYYHIYNRGVDKRTVFEDRRDQDRFLESVAIFNDENSVGSIFQHKFQDQLLSPSRAKDKLVNIIAYCLNTNHYHLILEQRVDRGIERFMQKVGAGYTLYFNAKYKRAGVLFQGRFKAKYIDTNEYLLYLSAYVNLNFKVHKLSPSRAKSSLGEYVGTNKDGLCTKEIILNQFKSGKEYKKDAEGIVEGIAARRYDVADLLLE